MSPEFIARQFDVSRESMERLAIHVELVRKWNSRVNLVASGTLADIWHRHVADSLQLKAYLPERCQNIADLGSGAGFPGLVLCIATGIDTLLIESIGKKAAFLAEAIRQTGARARVHSGRIESLPIDFHADVVTARAVAPLSRLVGLAFPLLSAGATGLFLKGQDFEAELTESTKYWRMACEVHTSVTDSKGAVLVIKEVQRA